jgi:hypothetical protein
MVTVLGWERRREYEELFDYLTPLGRFKTPNKITIDGALTAVADAAISFEAVTPETQKYFDGFFQRGPKAWTLAYAIEVMAGIDK